MVRALVAGCIGLLAFSVSSRADFMVEYSASAASNPGTTNPVGADVVFDLNGNTLKVTLKNTAGANTIHYQNGDALLGVFFGASAFNLTPGSAVAPETVHTDGTVICSANCDVSPGWEFANTSAHSASNGIAAAGYNNDFGSGNFTPGPGIMLDGVDYGIVPANYPGTLGSQINKDPLEVNSVTFTLTFTSGAPASATALQSALGNVTFQYGTSLSEFSASGGGGTILGSPVPEPMAIFLLAPVAVWAFYRIRKRRPA